MEQHWFAFGCLKNTTTTTKQNKKEKTKNNGKQKRKETPRIDDLTSGFIMETNKFWYMLPSDTLRISMNEGEYEENHYFQNVYYQLYNRLIPLPTVGRCKLLQQFYTKMTMLLMVSTIMLSGNTGKIFYLKQYRIKPVKKSQILIAFLIESPFSSIIVFILCVISNQLFTKWYWFLPLCYSVGCTKDDIIQSQRAQLHKQ